jgi:hypothetical protein
LFFTLSHFSQFGLGQSSDGNTDHCRYCCLCVGATAGISMMKKGRNQPIATFLFTGCKTEIL